VANPDPSRGTSILSYMKLSPIRVSDFDDERAEKVQHLHAAAGFLIPPSAGLPPSIRPRDHLRQVQDGAQDESSGSFEKHSSTLLLQRLGLAIPTASGTIENHILVNHRYHKTQFRVWQ
jgi:hypothetical protein